MFICSQCYASCSRIHFRLCYPFCFCHPIDPIHSTLQCFLLSSRSQAVPPKHPTVSPWHTERANSIPQSLLIYLSSYMGHMAFVGTKTIVPRLPGNSMRVLRVGTCSRVKKKEDRSVTGSGRRWASSLETGQEDR